MHWFEATFPGAAENLAADEALLDLAETHGGDYLRFLAPSDRCVVVGYGNHLSREVDLEACALARVPVLRRCTGGGTVVLGPGCLAYSLVLEIERRPELATITSTNRFVMERHRAALAPLARDAVRVDGHTDLVLGERKFSGNAQRRRRRAVLFHGTFLHDFDLTWIPRLLRFPSLQPEYRRDRDHLEFVTNFPASAARLRDALISAWSATQAPVPPWDDRIAALRSERYERAEWHGKFA